MRAHIRTRTGRTARKTRGFQDQRPWQAWPQDPSHYRKILPRSIQFLIFLVPFILWISIVTHRIVMDFVSARLITVEVLKKYLEERVFPKLGKRKFAVLYVHTDVQRSENLPGISALRSIYDAIPTNVKENLEAFYFIHPGLQARLFLATLGRFLFNAGYVWCYLN